jgi:hypothetical protein
MPATASCFICGGDAFDCITPAYRRCVDCGHEIFSAHPDQTLILNETLDARPAMRASALERFQGAILARFISGLPRRQFVDIGSAGGRFLFQQRPHFERACGLEITPAAVEHSRNVLGVTVHVSIEEVPEPIDVATAWHSLEHFPPDALVQLLARLSEKMPAGARFIVSVPNGASFQYRLFRQHYAFFDVPNHMHQFTSDSLVRLLGAHGFVRRDAVISWPYNVFGYAQGLLNLVIPGHNVLYYRWKRGVRIGSAWAEIVSVVLLLPLAPLVALLSLLDVMFSKKQGVLTYVFEKRR